MTPPPPEICETSSSATQQQKLSVATSKHYEATAYAPKIEYEDQQNAGTNFDDNAPIPQSRASCDSPDFLLHPMSLIPPEGNILEHDLQLLHKAHHGDPFLVLGPHGFTQGEKQCLVIRAWIKDAESVKVRFLSKSSCKTAAPLKNKEGEEGWVQMQNRADWLFQVCFTWEPTNSSSSDHLGKELLALTDVLYEYEVTYLGDSTDSKYILRDAYSMKLILPDYDLKLFQSGSCWHVDSLMGSHITTMSGAEGVRFAVWAPNASFVSVVGDFNQWDGRAHPMRRRHEYGVWELFVPSVAQRGHKYGYRIHSASGADFVKIDPYAQEFENPPAYASVISSCDDAFKLSKEKYQWDDEVWMAKRSALSDDEIHRMPMSIYEVHLPSWMRGDNNSYLSYRELAQRLVNHLKYMNFTHVEFLPVAHHPFEGSWGYQVSGLYAPYSRLGSADDFKYLIDELHKNDIGVFIDFVPAHFVKDSWGLVYYDGQPCYEYADPREGEHRTWGTMVFDFKRNEVRSFILGAAYHWLRRYHVDGLRIDAVSAMLYKNYCREPGDWVPNEFGGDANLEAISLLQELNWVVHKEFPGVFTMAEEATSWAHITDKKKGLGFDAKWDLGWMNDSLAYLCTPTPQRPQKHSKLTFRGLYMSHEKWILPLSHDEVVSGKGSLLDKCGFSDTSFEERIQTLKALYGYQIGLPGRPLIFMGGEFGQGREWKEARSIDWHEATEPSRKGCMVFVSDLLKIKKTEDALHKGDDEIWNFQWAECDNAVDCVIAWLRKYQDWFNDILCVANFSGNYYQRFPIGVPHGGAWKVLINSDDWKYAGAMRGAGNGCEVHATQGGRLGWPYCLWPNIPPFSFMMFKAPQPPASNETIPPLKETTQEEETATQTQEKRRASMSSP